MLAAMSHRQLKIVRTGHRQQVLCEAIRLVRWLSACNRRVGNAAGRNHPHHRATMARDDLRACGQGLRDHFTEAVFSLLDLPDCVQY